MSLITEPFEMKAFFQIYTQFKEELQENNPTSTDIFMVNELTILDQNVHDILDMLKACPAMIADKFYKLQACIKYNQSIGFTPILGLKHAEILHLGSPPQFLVLLPADQFLYSPLSRDNFIAASSELAFITFNTILAMEFDESHTFPYHKICLNLHFQERKKHAFRVFFEYLISSYKIDSIPYHFRQFV